MGLVTGKVRQRAGGLLLGATLALLAAAPAQADPRPVTGDTVAPEVYIYFNAGIQTKDTRPVIDFWASDDPDAQSGTGIDHIEVRIDDGAAQVFPATTTQFRPASALADGEHTIEIAAYDTSANQGLGYVTFTVDTTPTPVAGLYATDSALTGDVVEVTGSGSYDTDFNGTITHYEWDFDGDGVFEVDAGLTTDITHTYTQPGVFNISLRVTNDSGGSAVKSQAIDIRPFPPEGEVGVSINDGDVATNSPNVTLSLVWPRYANSALVSNDGGFGPKGSTATLALAPKVPWTLASSGPERLPKTVYVRFKGANSDDTPYTDDIILDERVPAVDGASLAAPKAAPKGSYAVSLDAKDDNSGVAVAEFYAKRKGKPLATVRFVPRTKQGERKLDRVVNVESRKPPKFVAVVDSAGNNSQLERIKDKHRNL